MSLLFRFEDERELFDSVRGCPLGCTPPSTDRTACARCPYNAAWPGEAEPGCHVDLPLPVWEAGCAALERSSPELHQVLVALRRQGPTVAPADTHGWQKLALALNALPSTEAREVAATVNAFALASQRTQRPVRVAE